MRVGEDNYKPCSAAHQGACDCCRCLERIVRHCNVLLKKGWYVNYHDNGLGGYGFDVNTLRECLSWLTEQEGSLVAVGDLTDEEVRAMVKAKADHWPESTFVLDELTKEAIELLVKTVVPTAWADQDDAKLVAEWERWWHLLPVEGSPHKKRKT